MFNLFLLFFNIELVSSTRRTVVVKLVSFSWIRPTVAEFQGVLQMWVIGLYLQLFRERLSEKKNIKVHATRPKGGLGIHWNFSYWPRGNLQVCIFARGEFVFPLRRPISVVLLLQSHVFEWGKILLNFRGSKRTLFLHVWKERKPEIRAYFVVISH